MKRTVCFVLMMLMCFSLFAVTANAHTDVDARYAEALAKAEAADKVASDLEAEYIAAMTQFLADKAAYDAAKAQYDIDKAQYDILKAQYDIALAAYNAVLAQYDIDLAAYNTAFAQYETDLAAYNAALAAYNAAQAMEEPVEPRPSDFQGHDAYDIAYAQWLLDVAAWEAAQTPAPVEPVKPDDKDKNKYGNKNDPNYIADLAEWEIDHAAWVTAYAAWLASVSTPKPVEPKPSDFQGHDAYDNAHAQWVIDYAAWQAAQLVEHPGEPPVAPTAPTAPGNAPVAPTAPTAPGNAPVAPSRTPYEEARAAADKLFAEAEAIYDLSVAQHFGTWKGEKKDVFAVINGKYDEFVKLSLNGKDLVAGKDFTSYNGCTVIMLTPEFLAPMANGNYTFVAAFEKGAVNVNLTVDRPVVKNTNDVQTGDDMSGAVWMAFVMMISLYGLAFVFIKQRKGQVI